METTANGQVITDHLRTLFTKNHEAYTFSMVELVISRNLAKKYGPRYTADSLQNLAIEMDANVQELLPGTGYVCKERGEAMTRKEKEERENKRKNSYSLEIKEPMSHHDNSKPILKLRNFLHSQLYQILVSHIPAYKIMQQLDVRYIDYHTLPGTTIMSNHFTFEVVTNGKETQRRVKATVTIQDPRLPVAQEEYFHAAQEITFGNVGGLEYLDTRIGQASGHVTHSSILLDRVLSAAAADIGPEEFAYWANKADEETTLFQERYVRDLIAPWDRTPLGKEVNKRFRYPIIDYRELGAILANVSLCMDEYLFLDNGRSNTDNQALIDILSLQFGRDHQKIIYQLLDMADTTIATEADFERIGREAVEWGKILLRHYKGKPGEKELVTHHSHIENPVNIFVMDEIPRRIGTRLNQELRTNHAIPTTQINLQQLAQAVYDSSIDRVGKLIDICFPDDGNLFVEPHFEILEKYKLTTESFRESVKRAIISYKIYQKKESEFHQNDRNPPFSSHFRTTF